MVFYLYGLLSLWSYIIMAFYYYGLLEWKWYKVTWKVNTCVCCCCCCCFSSFILRVCLYAYMSICLSECLLVCLSVCLADIQIDLSVCLFNSVCLIHSMDLLLCLSCWRSACIKFVFCSLQFALSGKLFRVEKVGKKDAMDTEAASLHLLTPNHLPP